MYLNEFMEVRAKVGIVLFVILVISIIIMEVVWNLKWQKYNELLNNIDEYRKEINMCNNLTRRKKLIKKIMKTQKKVERIRKSLYYN